MTKKNYQGHLLAANPSNPHDELDRAVILLLTHNDKAALGIQINMPLDHLSMDAISSNLGIELGTEDVAYRGGNNNVNKISVIHSTDWTGHSSVLINEHLAVTNDISVLAALSRGEGPEFYRACAGYWLWEPGQLDEQLNPQTNKNTRYKWEAVPARPENIFGKDGNEQWHDILEESARHQVAAWF
jgi:putative transcriptional regulator